MWLAIIGAGAVVAAASTDSYYDLEHHFKKTDTKLILASGWFLESAHAAADAVGIPSCKAGEIMRQRVLLTTK